MGIVVYVTTTSGNLSIRKNQQKIEMILSGKKVAYVTVDVSADEEAKKKMREICGDPKALPPQICNGDTYCGNYEGFEAATEEERLEEFLKL